MRRAIAVGNSGADLIEIRADFLPKPDLEPLLRTAEKPVIVTNRRRRDGGRFAGPEDIRLGILREAVDLGAAFVDIEAGCGKPSLRAFMGGGKKTRIILSCHDFRGTPSAGALRELCRRLMGHGPDVVKIVTSARSWEDNFRVLALIPFARERNQEIVAFCMGERGKMSRVFAPLMGAAWTYASIDRKKASAPGQLTIGELRRIWEVLG